MDVKLILTLNFETLFERACIDENLPVTAFDVFRDASLPHEMLLHSGIALVKVHGSGYGLRLGERIDYALDYDTAHRIQQLSPITR